MTRTGAPDPFAVYPSFHAGSDALVVAAPAKLNLFLEIVRRRPDGYHDLKSLMLAVDLFDTLEVRATEPNHPAPFPGKEGGVSPSPFGGGAASEASGVGSLNAVSLVCEPPGLTNGPDNLVVKAATALRSHVARPDLGAAIRLTKRIPTQAGLGGGSSDAALTLLALNRVWKLALTRAELAAIAASIGSDVAFFLTPPLGWCEGRGERVTPEWVGRPLDFVLVCPPVGLATADVYRRLAVPSSPRSGEAVRAAVRSGDAEAVGRELFNRLEEPAFALSPPVERVRARLAGLAPCGAMMSGSGSAVFAACRDRAEANRVAAAFRESRPAAEPESLVLVVRSLAP